MMLFKAKDIRDPRIVHKKLLEAHTEAHRALKKGDWYDTLPKQAADLLLAYMEGCNIKNVLHAKELLEKEKEARQRDNLIYCYKVLFVSAVGGIGWGLHFFY